MDCSACFPHRLPCGANSRTTRADRCSSPAPPHRRVLGSDLIALGLPFRFAEVLFGIAIAAWVILTYAFLAAVTEGREKPPLETGLNGAWLLIVVSTASLAVLGGDLLKQLSPAPFLTFACSVWLGLAWLYYALLGSMIFYRFVFIPMPSEDITGPWWINAGAAAITVLAGAQLLAQPGSQWAPSSCTT